jgi:hypothetical protein
MNPLMEPFLYDAVSEHQAALRESADTRAPEVTARAVCVDVGRASRGDCALPRLFRLLTAVR